ncbi:cell division protein FtsL [Roseitranquillus sediminis]|uniref:cell division protein FtsL n=1 Tax=Roseitranquillus sediminis TaxID=2809051 RepID=UPI001D0C7DCD|nr:cell division protein FtsL [Roseitranquillus sediminis]MBM9594595.1 cell division protein FtsL [Roseitranquillus sediminis]
MRPLVYIISVFCVMALAAWAYRENFRTQSALREVELLRAQIGTLRERRSVLSAEWAWLNRPERLRDLAEMNYERLGLLPLRPEQFARIDELAFPPADAMVLPDPVDLAEMGEEYP